MSLFVAGLALTDETHIKAAKLGILVTSAAPGAVGSVILTRQPLPTCR
jgi:Na+/H+ antiporter NhaA